MTRPAPAGWTLDRRLAAALAAAGVVVLGAVLLATLLLLQVQRTQDAVVADHFRAYRISTDLYVGQLEAETAVRGYVLTGDEAVLAPYERAMADGDGRRYDELLAALGDAPEVRDRLDAAAASARAWSLTWAEPAVELVRSEGPAAVDPAEIARGQALFDAVRRDFMAYQDALAAVREQARDDLRLRTALLFVGVAAAAIGSVLVGAGLWWALRRWVRQPIAELASETRVVAEGHLDHELHVSGPPEIVTLAGDVESMRRRLSGQLRQVEQARAELEEARERLQEQAAELQRSNTELEQFAYVASHDLQEPLRKVASFCQLLERRYKGQLDDRADQYIAFAVDGAKRMQQLINDLLAFSRVGRIGSSWADVPLAEALAVALRNLEAAVEESGAEVTADPLPVVRGDRGLLVQLLQNLVGNGIKFRGADPPRVHIGARRVGEEWELSCSDDGIGIEPQYADRIFVIFQRLHPKDEYDGTGIGLALCKKIVEFHGGRIWLDPKGEKAGGTTFRWTLPVAPVDEVPEGGGDAAAPGSTPEAVEVAGRGGSSGS